MLKYIFYVQMCNYFFRDFLLKKSKNFIALQFSSDSAIKIFGFHGILCLFAKIFAFHCIFFLQNRCLYDD